MSNVLKMFGSMVGLTEEKKKIRQAIKELNALDDRELNDLGLSRGNIESVVRYGRQGEKRAA